MAKRPSGAGKSRHAHHQRANESAASLIPTVYDELRGLAARYVRNEFGPQTIRPTELVHEAFLRLTAMNRIDWQGRTHFFAVAAVQMRRILVEHGRKRRAAKRGGGWTRVTIASDLVPDVRPALDPLVLDQVLRKLEARNERQSRVAELRLFGGLTAGEIAETLGVSERTVKRDWRFARAWLSRELSPHEDEVDEARES